ncbi:putative leucine-rich repeat-containing protein DDB_G0290503 [Anopheles maculipalpis]|uniref:putative leucine-rich repeat-containing protein DDB_G0290503 n=1 Tax=Anopheles maculipalpis TaxID=1496333 RepID=UPI0021593F48|nr:putative leucine-rich repeat-containing protein DDB_G0290503 [Anopheles maculipalpis]
MSGPPGLSIFNDGVSINLNRSDRQNGLEEEELQEDQRRLQEELANEVENAFDDVICDDNDTLNSFSHRYSDEDDDTAGQSTSKRPPVPSMAPLSPRLLSNPALNPIEPGQMAPLNDYGGAARELRLLLESKTRELEHVTRELYEQRHKHEQQMGELEKRLLIEQAEKDRANMTRDQTRELLVQSKTKISEVEDTNDKLRAKVSSLEDEQVKLVAELEQKNLRLQDTLLRYRMLEQNTAQKADRHTDALLKQIEERHNAKVTMMQQQIDNLRSELNERQQDCRRLEARYAELQKSREAMLVEQSETVQRLQDQLEDSQRQCSNLLSKSKAQGDFEQERLQMRNRIRALEQEQSGLQQTIHDLTNRLEKTNAELDLMDSLVHGQVDVDEENPADGKRMGDATTGYTFAKRNLIGSTPNNNLRDRDGGGDGGDSDNRVVRLKNELRVCMAGQKEKRDLIRQLEANLQAKDRELEQLKRDESDTLVQMNQYKEEAFRLTSKCRILEQELVKLTADGTSSKQDNTLNRRRSSGCDLRQEAFLEDKIFSLQQAKLEADERIQTLDLENKQLSERCETLHNEVSSCAALKLEVEKQKFLLQDAQKECERLKRLYIEVSGAKEELGRELSTLRSQDSAKQIAVLQEQVVSLERALQLAELKASELGKLLDKEKTNHEELLKEVTAGAGASSSTIDGKAQQSHGGSCTKCIDALTQISKLEIENLKLQSSCSSQLREIAELKVQLNDQAATVTELHKRLDLKAERDQLLDELKEKAAQFEQIIRNQISTNSSSTTCDSATSPLRRVSSSRDQSVGTDDPMTFEDPESRRQMRELEQKVREEMAKVYAGKVNQIEEKFVAQFNRFKENIDTLKNELYDRVAELKVRNQEVEVLKCAIVTEREKMGELLAQKDADARSLFDKQSELMGKYKTELANGQQKVQFLERELQEKRELAANERQSMEKLIAQITAERKMFREREQEMNDRFKEVEMEYQKSLDLVTEKYQSAKKTALNYKKYAEDKEQHMLKEYDRIKEGYNVALQKVQTRMKEALESKEQSLRERIAKMEAEYETKLQIIRQKS